MFRKHPCAKFFWALEFELLGTVEWERLTFYGKRRDPVTGAGQREEMCRDVPGFHHLLHPTQPATTVYLGNTAKLGTCSVIKKKRTIHLLSSLINADLWSLRRRVVESACCGSSNIKGWVLFIKKNCGAFVEPFPFCTQFYECAQVHSSMTLTQWHRLCIRSIAPDSS